MLAPGCLYCAGLHRTRLVLLQVREMYAFSVALAANKMTTELKPPGLTDLIAQVRGRATV